MLTVKHIHPAGAQYIFQTDRVVYDDARMQSVRPTVFIEEPSGRQHDIDIGIVYVMNLNGATVAKYDLGSGPYSMPTEAPAEAPVSKAA